MSSHSGRDGYLLRSCLFDAHTNAHSTTTFATRFPRVYNLNKRLSNLLRYKMNPNTLFLHSPPTSYLLRVRPVSLHGSEHGHCGLRQRVVFAPALQLQPLAPRVHLARLFPRAVKSCGMRRRAEFCNGEHRDEDQEREQEVARDAPKGNHGGGEGGGEQRAGEGGGGSEGRQGRVVVLVWRRTWLGRSKTRENNWKNRDTYEMVEAYRLS